MQENKQQTFDDLLTPTTTHPCEDCKFFVEGKCTYPFSRTDYCISGSKKISN